MLIEHDTLCRHESTDDNKILTFRIPTEIVDWTLESVYFIYLSALVVENVQPILSVVGFACWVVVSL